MHKRIFLVIGLITSLLALMTCFVLVPAMMAEGQGLGFQDYIQMAYLRFPYVLQIGINGLIFLILCLGGYKIDGKRHMSWVWLSLACAFVSHPMVYGIDWFMPSSYSLLTYRHSPVLVIGLPTVWIWPQWGIWTHILSFLLHCLSFQVLFALYVMRGHLKEK